MKGRLKNRETGFQTTFFANYVLFASPFKNDSVL